jgi:excisionase family DNA binding protein
MPQPKPAVRPRLVSARQAADALSIGLTKVYELMDADELTTVHIGRRRLIPVVELDRFVERLEQAVS